MLFFLLQQSEALCSTWGILLPDGKMGGFKPYIVRDAFRGEGWGKRRKVS
jgi:hypothetical protein